MLIFAKFDIGDIVSVGPIEDGMIAGINFRSGITYSVSYWTERTPMEYVAWEWEIELVRKAAPQAGD